VDLDCYITTAEAAAIAGLSSVQVGNYCRGGLLMGACKLAGRWVIPREVFSGFLRSRKSRRSLDRRKSLLDKVLSDGN
jgi:hypothetical protein